MKEAAYYLTFVKINIKDKIPKVILKRSDLYLIIEEILLRIFAERQFTDSASF
jgi:hypothetical protein